MRIFLSVLIIVLCILIAVRLMALYLNTSGNFNGGERVLQIVGVITSIIVGVLSLLFMLGIVDGETVASLFGMVFLIISILMWICFLLMIVLFLIAPFLLIVFGIKRKKKIPVIVAASVWGPIYLFFLIVWMIYPREFPYIDLWIYGKDNSEIIAAYGEPEYLENNTLYYQCNWWDDKGYNYYCIELNDEGEARKIYQDFYDRTWAMGKTMEEIEEKFGTGNEWRDVYSYHVGSHHYDLQYDGEGRVISFSTSECW